MNNNKLLCRDRPRRHRNDIIWSNAGMEHIYENIKSKTFITLAYCIFGRFKIYNPHENSIISVKH